MILTLIKIMKVGVISDTHDNVSAVEEAVEVFREEGVDTLVHCGDYIAPLVIPYFDGFTLHGVLGNNDGEISGLNTFFDNLGDATLHGRYAELTFDDSSFAVLHGESKNMVYSLAASGDYDYVLYGHHHAKEKEELGGTVVVNPGAHFQTVPEEHRTVAVVDTDGDVEFHRVESM